MRARAGRLAGRWSRRTPGPARTQKRFDVTQPRMLPQLHESTLRWCDGSLRVSPRLRPRQPRDLLADADAIRVMVVRPVIVARATRGWQPSEPLFAEDGALGDRDRDGRAGAGVRDEPVWPDHHARHLGGASGHVLRLPVAADRLARRCGHELGDVVELAS